MTTPFDIVLESETDNYYLVKVTGELNGESTPKFEDFIKQLFFKEAKDIKLDLDDLDVIVSSAIGSLLLLHDTVTTGQKQFTIIKINEKIKSIISIIGLDNIIIL
ncbi:MAG: hypothetical protein COA79_01220 [Planctomycetota bacterium]|nr:MAG: hypothetical protein COA79_01220 [Planctomycetota bacterium]